MYRKLALTLLILSLLLTSVPCVADTTVTDMTGREITVPDSPSKIVVLSASDCEMLYAIGAGNAVIARGEYCDYPEEVVSLPSIQTGYEMNVEQVIAMEPQLVIMAKMGQTVEQVEALTNVGIPVFVSDAQTIDSIYDNISLLGTITGKQSEADALVDSMKASFDAVSAAASGKKIYFEVSPLEWGLWTAGKGTFLDEIASLIGIENIFSDLEGWASVSEEQVMDRNPDYIATTTESVGEMSGSDEILSRAAWSDITAVKNGNVMIADYNLFTRPGPRLADAAALLAEFIAK